MSNGPQGLINQTYLALFGPLDHQLVKMNSSANWVPLTTSDTDVFALPFEIFATGSPGGGRSGVQYSGMAEILNDGACTPGNVVVASSTTAGAIHDTGATAPSGTEFVVGICMQGGSPSMVYLTPQFN